MLEESGLVQRKSGQRLQVTLPHMQRDWPPAPAAC
jgi:hypothetical protein